MEREPCSSKVPAAYPPILVLALFIFLLTLNACSFKDADGTTSSSDSMISDGQLQYLQQQKVDSIMEQWENNEIDSNKAKSTLQALAYNGDPGLVQYITDKIDHILIEDSGSIHISNAKNLLQQKLYPEVLKALGEIDRRFSRYSEVDTLYESCKQAILSSVFHPTDEKEFESAISLLTRCLKYYPDADLISQKVRLNERFQIFKEVSGIINHATELYDTGSIQEAFFILASGLETYPTDERLAASLVNYRDHYVIQTTQSVLNLCELEKYNDALQLIDSSIEEYDCEEFHLLYESVKLQKSPLYRIKTSIVDRFHMIAQGWESDTLDVKSLADQTGAYVVKSGEKLLLGDYSDEDITVLSFGGNIVASLAGIDFLLDLRDLSYDVTHWGEEEYFALYLATDVVALVPVIGMIKYLDHFKPIADGITTSSELVDSIGDVGKGTDNLVEVADQISDVAKTSENIIDSVSSAKNVTRASEAVKDVTADIIKDYRVIDTINKDLVDKHHPKTNIAFVLKKLIYSDGQKIQGVFPKFHSFADIKLPKDLYKADFKDQKKYCLEQLQKKTHSLFGKYRSNFTDAQLKDIADGVLPEGFTWHHNEKEGLMQLVDSKIHDLTAHTGGMSLWGKGYERGNGQ